VNFPQWLKTGFKKWRLALLVFLIIYAFFLLLELGYMSIQWDEAPHLYGGLLLKYGRSQEYISNYGYYPPLYDLLTTGYFQTLGATAASGRLVAVTFSLLTIWIVFEFANRTYGPKTALISSILLGTMPGFFWISRVAMIETMLMFFFSLSMFFFLSWLRFDQNKTLILCGLALGIGFLAKYQIMVAGIVMLILILFLCRDKLRARLSKFLLLPIIALIVILPWISIVIQTNGLDRFGELLYVVQEGGQDRIAYSSRFPAPVFYLIELTWPFNDIPVHPISLPIYILSLLGIGLWAYRRKTEDKLFLIWFIVVYVFFTLIPNKQWRYITPIFPVLAISAASFLFFFYGRISAASKSGQLSLNNRRVGQIAAAFFIVLVASAIFYSSYETYQMTERDQIHIPIEEIVNYATRNMTQNESMVLVCAFNLLNQDMMRFYLPENMSKDQVWQYPELAVDSFTPEFNVTELVDLCEQRNAKWVIIYDYGPDSAFFNTTLTIVDAKTMMEDSGRFGKIADEPWYGFGTHPHRVFVFGFLHN